MNKLQIKILKLAASCITLMSLFPPFVFRGSNAGYHFVFSNTSKAVINVGQLFTEWCAVLLVAGLLWFATKDD